MKYFLVIFLTLLMTNFFGATDISKYILLFIILPFIFLEYSKKSIFKKYFIFVIIGLFINIISCYYFRGQSILSTSRITLPYIFFLFYFVLKRINLSISKMENVLLVISVIFCVCYIIQYIIYPIVIFSGANNENLIEENLRIRFMSQGFCSLGYFFGLNKYFQKKKTSYLFLSIFCFCVIFLMGFRTMMALIVLFTFVMIIRIKGFNWKFFIYGLITCGVFIAFLQLPLFTNIFNNMLERQKTQSFDNKEYIRIIQFLYFTQEHFQSFWEYIFGSGMPHDESQYGQYMQKLRNGGINYVDLGLISLSWIIGLITVSAMVAYAIKAFLLKVFSDYYYIGVWFIYLIVVSFTTMEFYRPGNFIVQALALYLVEKVHIDYLLRKQKMQNENRNINISPRT